MGVCGTAMGNAALLARANGHQVLGADAGIYPPMSTVLAEAGIELHEGYDAARLERLRPDLVVVGNAMSRGNVEVEWLLETRAIPFTSLPALLADFVLKGRKNIVIAGTHGKTTTTAIAAFLLRENGRDPGFLIGGVPQDPPMGSHLGRAADPFVIEGDEYDSAFFDKRSKFIHYAPHIAVMNNLEFDHADIFRDLDDVKRTFFHLSRIVPRNGWIVVNGNDANLAALGSFPWTRLVRVGLGDQCDVRLVDFTEAPEGASFALWWKGAKWADVRWTQPGLYNARNAAMAAVAAQLSLAPVAAGEPLPENITYYVTKGAALDLSPLARYRGVKRRQQLLLDTPPLKVIEDFGHHPTAVGEALTSFRARFPGHVIHAAFEPRSNTSRRRVMLDAFKEALVRADHVYLGPVARAHLLKPEERFDHDELIAFLGSRGVRACTAPANAELLEKLIAATRAETTKPQLVVFFTNGSFDGIITGFVKQAKD